jgi:hypothetical protein
VEKKTSIAPLHDVMRKTGNAWNDWLLPDSCLMPKRIPKNLELSDGAWSLNVEPLNFEPPWGFERLERFEPLRRTLPVGERSVAIERLERLERLEQTPFYRGLHLSHAACQLLYIVPELLNYHPVREKTAFT